jgi:hypothetical protein
MAAPETIGTTDMIIFQSKSIRVTANVLKTVNANFSRENGTQRIWCY